MPSSEEKNRWVRRWRYLMGPTSRHGIWKLKDGGYFVRVRVTDPRTGRRVQCARALRGMTTASEGEGPHRPDRVRVRRGLSGGRAGGGEPIDGPTAHVRRRRELVPPPRPRAVEGASEDGVPEPLAGPRPLRNALGWPIPPALKGLERRGIGG